MSLGALLTQTARITQRAPGAPDEYNDPTTQDQAPVDYPCRFEQRSSFEVRIGEDRLTVDGVTYLPPDAVLGHLDKVTIVELALDFEVNGEPVLHSTPYGPHHVEVPLRRLEGA